MGQESRTDCFSLPVLHIWIFMSALAQRASSHGNPLKGHARKTNHSHCFRTMPFADGLRQDCRRLFQVTLLEHRGFWIYFDPYH